MLGQTQLQLVPCAQVKLSFNRSRSAAVGAGFGDQRRRSCMSEQERSWEFDRNISIFPDAALTFAEEHRSNGLKKTEEDRRQVLTPDVSAF